MTEIAVTDTQLRLLFRPYGTYPVVLLTEPIPAHAHGLRQAPDTEIPLACVVRHIRLLQSCLIQRRIAHIMTGIDRCRAGQRPDQRDIRPRAERGGRTDANPLRKPALTPFEIIFVRRTDRCLSRDTRLSRLLLAGHDRMTNPIITEHTHPVKVRKRRHDKRRLR